MHQTVTPSAALAGRFAFAALIAANLFLALGPWMVRLADVGPVSAGFWRLALAIPLLLFLAWRTERGRLIPERGLLLLIVLSGFFFALDLAAWHYGILRTKLANATLFGNTSSLLFAAWGLWLARKRPSALQASALALAAIGAGLLMGGSAELSARNLRGDLLALFAGVLYTGYLVAVQRGRGKLQPLPLLFLASAFGAAMLLPVALGLGEKIIPDDWTFVFVLALSSQVLGQGLLVYALGSLSPLVVGLTLLTQPAVSALAGWFAYGETLSATDLIGAAAIATALVLVRLPKGLRTPASQPSGAA